MNLGSIALYALDRISEVPSTISGLPMQRIAETTIEDLKNYTGDEISTTDIPVRFQNVLINLTAAYTVGFMAGIGVDFNASLGEFSVNPAGGPSSSEKQQMQFFVQQANRSLHYIGRKLNFAKALG